MTTANEAMAAAYLQLARVYRDDGREDLAAAYEVAADSLGATCPHCGGELLSADPSGPPVDGREVDRAPERYRHRAADYLSGMPKPDFLTPQTDGGVSADPPGATPPSPHATKES